MATAPWPLDRDDLTSQVRFIVWELEGGKFGATVTSAPHDRGQQTVAGLTWRCYSEDYLHLPKGQRCPIADFEKLSLDDVVTVLAEVFALRTNLWPIRDALLRLAVVDFAINAGVDDAIPALQRAAGVAADGICGSETLQAVNAGDPALLRDCIFAERYEKAARVVLADRDQLANLHGWLVRFGRVLTWRPTAGAR